MSDAELAFEHVDIRKDPVPATKHVPGKIVARIEFYRFVSGVLDLAGSFYLFLNAHERQHLSVTDRNGELRLGIIWSKCCRSLA